MLTIFSRVMNMRSHRLHQPLDIAFMRLHCVFDRTGCAHCITNLARARIEYHSYGSQHAQLCMGIIILRRRREKEFFFLVPLDWKKCTYNLATRTSWLMIAHNDRYTATTSLYVTEKSVSMPLLRIAWHIKRVIIFGLLRRSALAFDYSKEGFLLFVISGSARIGWTIAIEYDPVRISIATDFHNDMSHVKCKNIISNMHRM